SSTRRRTQKSTLFPYTTLFRSKEDLKKTVIVAPIGGIISKLSAKEGEVVVTGTMNNPGTVVMTISDLSKMQVRSRVDEVDVPLVDRKSTRLNSSHVSISYAVFC